MRPRTLARLAETWDHLSVMNRIVLALLAAVAATGCVTSSPRVEQYGGMREVLREGKAQRRIGLSDAVARPHAYGVGALENLGGEITIADGEVWIGRVEAGKLRVSGPSPSSADGAALLIIANVDNWKRSTLPEAAAGAELESAVERIARQNGVDTNRPFPFEIDGQLTALSMHAVNGACPLSDNARTDGDGAPWRFTLDHAVHGRIVGFFARDSAGEITHHGTSIHAHALLDIDGTRLTGHVEHLAVGPGAVVRVSAVR
jgi:acetolactate decarboxylase